MNVAAVAQSLEISESSSAWLLNSSINALASSRLESSIADSVNAFNRREVYLTEDDRDAGRDEATELLWLRLTEGVGELAGVLLGRPNAVAENAEQIFRQVISLSSEIYPASQNTFDSTVVSNFAGPSFLASLLLRLTSELPSRGVVNVDPPDGVDSESWRSFTTSLAMSRPIIWSNHADAIASGYLTLGMSAVMSFPTGAGKSTLSELKIATYVLSRRKVIFLAPTHALANQIRQSLKTTFPAHDVRDSIIGDGFYAEVGEESTSFADITVMTPERCLMLLDLHASAFREVGLIVMDECHLLHPSRGSEDRRAIDAMLALLRSSDAASDADIVLLSAMVSNANELAAWIHKSLGKVCLPLDLRWKPTRQAKGCVIYERGEVNALEADIASTRALKETKTPPVALKRRMDITPHGLFALTQNWNLENFNDYHQCRIVSGKVRVGIKDNWSLAGNKNGVAASLSSDFSLRHVNTIVFSPKKSDCESIAAQAAEKLAANDPIDLDEVESALRLAAIDEAGGEEHAYLPSPAGVCCHHGLLNTVERELAERFFRREDGGRVIVATPTLAQGMNLPAEAVIIAGVRRFDASVKRPIMMNAHDLLNATGRSGRAGHRPEGIVLLLTDDLIVHSLSDNVHQLTEEWFELIREVFSHDDQCLSIEDPIEIMLDSLQLLDALPSGTPSYFVNRLPLPNEQNEAARLLSKSLGAYKAAKEEEQANYQVMIDLAVARRREFILSEPERHWLDQLASTNGIAAVIIKSLADEFPSQERATEMGVIDWVDHVFEWAKRHPKFATNRFDRESLETVLGKLVLPKDAEVVDASCFEHLRGLFHRYIDGSTLVEIQRHCPKASTQNAKLGFCHRARKLTQRTSMDVSVLLGLLPQIYRDQIAPAERGGLKTPTALAVASACARNGLNSPEQLATALIAPKVPRYSHGATRRGIHQLFRDISPFLIEGEPHEAFAEVRKRVKVAVFDYLVTE
ncbi:DEAD/DEAH box helicase [Rhodopirellula sp. P2]|uniref:DEAD/DEAH box helicase n=1 Tax=Rhodopirellula sp. P2 TaxID=2127060 RepID=UPI0023685B15|nr:DEAD/DEAH box helicase [Rhodopirellula sp. P2]WDQ17041.1 DEAD/DEAH box helicase [Rhodopirellula sp. P2]